MTCINNKSESDSLSWRIYKCTHKNNNNNNKMTHSSNVFTIIVIIYLFHCVFIHTLLLPYTFCCVSFRCVWVLKIDYFTKEEQKKNYIIFDINKASKRKREDEHMFDIGFYENSGWLVVWLDCCYRHEFSITMLHGICSCVWWFWTSFFFGWYYIHSCHTRDKRMKHQWTTEK